MSAAYNEWVRVEHIRLWLTGEPSLCNEFDRLTVENKKRRLLFAKGRKEPIGGRRKVR